MASTVSDSLAALMAKLTRSLSVALSLLTISRASVDGSVGGCAASGELYRSQDAVLRSLYSATAGAHWQTNTNWLNSSAGHDSWHGITCNGTTGRIAGIGLENNNLTGTIPSELGSLAQLADL